MTRPLIWQVFVEASYSKWYDIAVFKTRGSANFLNSGTPWTFDNKQDGDRNVRVRLDRAVADPSWSSLFPNYQVHHLTSSTSDHCPIMVNLDYTGAVIRPAPVRRYECYWEREESLGDEVACAWTMHKKPDDLGDIASNLQGVMSTLHDWSDRTIRFVQKQLKQKKE
jgi:hypothetical protein